MQAISREEFVAGYAARSGYTPEILKELGVRALPCACEEPKCQGWQMLDYQAALTEARLGRLDLETVEAAWRKEQ